MNKIKISDFKPDAQNLYRLLGKEEYITNQAWVIVSESSEVASQLNEVTRLG